MYRILLVAFIFAPLLLEAQVATTTATTSTTTQEAAAPTSQPMDPNKPVITLSEPPVGVDLDGRLTEDEYQALLDSSQEFTPAMLALRGYQIGFTNALHSESGLIFFTTVDGRNFRFPSSTPMMVYRDGGELPLGQTQLEEFLFFAEDAFTVTPLRTDVERGTDAVIFYTEKERVAAEPVETVDSEDAQATTSSTTAPTRVSPSTTRTNVTLPEDIEIIRNAEVAERTDIRVGDRVWLIEENGSPRILVANGPTPIEPLTSRTFQADSTSGFSMPSWYFLGALAIGLALLVAVVAFMRKSKKQPRKKAKPQSPRPQQQRPPVQGQQTNSRPNSVPPRRK